MQNLHLHFTVMQNLQLHTFLLKIIPPCNVEWLVGKIRSMGGGGDSRGISCSFSTLCYTDFKRCEKKL
jgi:hypothetical protein